MASYIILEPATLAERSRPGYSDRVRFVKDGFSLLALILPVIWLLLHRLWWHAAAVFLSGVIFGYIGSLFGSTFTGTALTVLLAVFVALEGKNWYLAVLQRRGLVETAIIAAPSREEAEIRYFYGNDAINRPVAAPVSVYNEPVNSGSDIRGKTLSVPLAGNMADEQLIGLVDYRGKI